MLGVLFQVLCSAGNCLKQRTNVQNKVLENNESSESVEEAIAYLGEHTMFAGMFFLHCTREICILSIEGLLISLLIHFVSFLKSNIFMKCAKRILQLFSSISDFSRSARSLMYARFCWCKIDIIFPPYCTIMLICSFFCDEQMTFDPDILKKIFSLFFAFEQIPAHSFTRASFIASKQTL